MPTPHSPKVTILEQVYLILQRIANSGKSEQRLSLRAMFILRMGEGKPNRQIAKEFSTQAKTVKKWRYRWLAAEEVLQTIVEEQSSSKHFQKILRAEIERILSDAERSGAPPTYQAEDYARVLEVALEDPSESGRAIDRWTNRELSAEVKKRGICQISTTQVGRFLKRSGLETPSD